MENASKALLLAGGVLISLIIISMLVLVINSLTSYQDSQSLTVEARQLEEFNRQIEAYNREDVRGNEIVTLANKIIDYNRSKTVEVEKNYDMGGEKYNFTPIDIIVDMKTNKAESEPVFPEGAVHGNVFSNITGLNGNNLFKKTLCQVDNCYHKNAFQKIFNDLRELENKYPSGALGRLATHTSGLFLEIYGGEEPSADEKNKAIQYFNVDCGYNVLNSTEWKYLQKENPKAFYYADKFKLSSDPSDLMKTTKIVQDVYKYYEYVQFKRCIFDCDYIEYDTEGAGTVKEIKFVFTGFIE